MGLREQKDAASREFQVPTNQKAQTPPWTPHAVARERLTRGPASPATTSRPEKVNRAMHTRSRRLGFPPLNPSHLLLTPHLPPLSSDRARMAMSRAAAAAAGTPVARRRLMGAVAARSMASWFGHVEPAAKDPILGVTEAFLADPSPDKVNVGVVRICSLPPPPPFHHELSRLIPELCVCVRRRARTGTTAGSPWCWSACARRSGGSPGA